MVHAKRYAHFILIAALALTLAACNDFLNINQDPNNATRSDLAKDPGLVFITPLTALSSTKNVEIVGVNSVAQTWSANTASVFTNPELYTFSTFTTGNSWETIYVDAAQNFQQVIGIARQAKQSNVAFDKGNVVAQAKIMKNYSYFMATQLWGKVPFTQANKADQFSNPKADPQETVLRGIVDSLDAAIAKIDAGASKSAITDRDLFYGGDMKGWKKFANTIKFRALLLLDSGGKDVSSEINTLLSQGTLIRSNEYNALFPYGTNEGNENNFFQVLEDFSGGVQFWYDCAEPLVDAMKPLNDPRLSTYCTLPADPSITTFKGQESGDFQFGGVTPVGDADEFANVSSNIIRPAFPERYATAAEVLLKEAEWAVRQGNFSTAQSKLEAGVRASMDFFDGRPGEIPESEEDAFVGRLPDLSTLGSSGAINFIQRQQYIDLFERHPANWTHWRRTKTPDLDAPANAQLNTVARRFAYPPGPSNTNPNLPASPALDKPMFFE